MSVDGDGWIEGGATVGFQWASTGAELLIRQDERVRLFDVGEKPVERASHDLHNREVIGVGHANRAWWLLAKEAGQVRLRSGFSSEGVLLERANAETVALPAVSPDGRTLACAESGLTVTFWEVDTGRRLFSFVAESETGVEDIFGPPEIARIGWSADSRCLALQPSLPVQGVTVIDVSSRRIMGTIA